MKLKIIDKIKIWWFLREDFYCKICRSCGESDCCSPLMCAYNNMVKYKKHSCLYGKEYYMNLKLSYIAFAEISEYICTNKQIDEQKFDEIYSGIYNEVYKEEEKIKI